MPIAQLAYEAARLVAERALTYSESRTPAPHRPRGRGSALTACEQLAVMIFAVQINRASRVVAGAFGVHRRTAHRILRSKRFELFRAEFDRNIIRIITGNARRFNRRRRSR